MISFGAFFIVIIDDQKTLRKVPKVNPKDTKPIMLDTIEMGANVECETVTPIVKVDQ